MAWPKLRNKSSGSLMTENNRSGAAHDGARSHGGAPQGASGGSARGPAAPVPDAPAAPTAWPGSIEDPEPLESLGYVEGLGAVDGPRPVEDEVAAPEIAGAEVAGAEVGVAEPESADLPLWDWSPPGESVPEDEPEDEPAAQLSDPPRSEWKPVVTPVEEVTGTPGIGQRRGNLAHLSADPRMRV